MKNSSGKSERRAHVKRRRGRSAARVQAEQNSLGDVAIGAGIKVVASAFAVAGVVAFLEGHGEPSPDYYPQPRPVAHQTMMAQTSAGSSGLFKIV